MEKGYIVFNADGSKPKAMLAAMDNGEGIQIVVEGKSLDILKMWGCIAQSLNDNCKMNEETLIDTLKTALKTGGVWASMMTLIADKGREKAKELFDIED